MLFRWRTLEERDRLRRRLSHALDIPFAVLAVIAVLLFALQLALPTSPEWAALIRWLGTAIWLLFLADFVVELGLAADKIRFMRQNWIVALSVLLPFFGALRILRAARFLRPYTLIRAAAVMNRGLRELRSLTRGRQFVYVLAMLSLTWVAGAASLFFLERGDVASPFRSLGDALWYSVRVITTLGADPGPATLEGKLVAVLLMIVGVAFFGYVTAAIASYFVRQDAGADQEARERLYDELKALRQEVESLRRSVERQHTGVDAGEGRDADEHYPLSHQ